MRVAVALLTLTTASGVGGQASSEPDRPAPAFADAAAGPLPLTDIVLFTSGVGYFQRGGSVDGTTIVQLDFKTNQVSDLLKSMVVRDCDGGVVSGVSYSPRDPLNRILQTFAIDLSSNPGIQALLAQMRGNDVAIRYTIDRGPEREPEHGSARGTVLGIERAVTGATVVNLVDEGEVSPVDLATIDSVRVLTPRIAGALHEALDLIASTKREEDNTVSVAFSGNGRRRVQVGYLLESPIWKTSYRLLVGEQDEHLLQGWGIVENTTEEDWRDVRLTLVSGQPISFRMELYEPHYVQRPASH